MTWIDVAGRWLILGLGAGIVFSLVIVVWGYSLVWFINVTHNTKDFIEYLLRREKKRPRRHKMSKEEEEEYRKIHRQKNDKEA